MYITRQAELRQKSRQIKTYLVVIYGNAYTPCWPAAAAQLGFVSFHLSPQFASVCLHCCTPICLPFASLSFFLLSFPLPSPALPHSPPPRALFVCVCACCWCGCCCCSCAHALFRATFAQIKRNFGNFESIFSRHFSVFLQVFL